MSSPSKITDVWSSVLRGDQSALKQIYLDYHQALFQYGMRMLSDEEACRDAIHNLFLKIWTNRKSLRYTDQVKYYLMSALRNEIINYKARESRYDRDPQYLEGFLLDFSVETVLIRKEEANEQTKKMADAMNQLTPRQKEIIYLRFFEELDYDQIADMMNITVKGAYKLSARALDALKDIMQVDKVVLIGMLLAAKHQFWS